MRKEFISLHTDKPLYFDQDQKITFSYNEIFILNELYHHYRTRLIHFCIFYYRKKNTLSTKEDQVYYKLKTHRKLNILPN